MAWVIDNQFSLHWKQSDKQEVPIQDFFQTECHDFGHLYIGLLFYLIILVSKYFGIKTQVNLLQQLNIMIDYRAKSTNHIRLNRVKLNGVLLIALRQRIEKFGKQKFYHSLFIALAEFRSDISAWPYRRRNLLVTRIATSRTEQSLSALYLCIRIITAGIWKFLNNICSK